ncbi:MAG: hypothetical protein EOO43_19590 [Flavobacterium sp.]|nr:MAG: hypothetical protein EOO43_19590 [Flavobacterium sp.]
MPERFTSSRRTSGSSSYDTGQGGGQIEDSVQESANEELQPSRSNGVVIQANSGGISSVNLADTNSVLIAEISGGDRWKQANFDLETFEGFFGATAGDNSYFIKLRHVDSSGTITDEVLSQAVSVKSSNYRFELAAAAGIPFPSNGYPLGIFIKVGPDRFLYNLCLPDETFYQEVRNFLDSRWTGSNNRRMRIITNVATLKVNCPNLPLWINED